MSEARSAVARLSVEPVVRQPASAPAVAVAREMIRWLTQSGEVTVGQRLPSERELAAAFRVGRSAVREALKSLSLLGLVEIRQGAGTYVTTHTSDLLPKVIEWGLILDEERVHELIEARQVLEVSLAELAASRRTEEELGEIRAAFAAMDAAKGDVDRWVAADVEFHLVIARAAHNDVLGDLLVRLRDLLRMWIRRASQLNTDFDQKLSDHEAVLRSIEAGDAKGAGEAMGRHMAGAYARLEVNDARYSSSDSSSTAS